MTANEPAPGTLADVYLRMLAAADADAKAGSAIGEATWREAAAMVGELP